MAANVPETPLHRFLEAIRQATSEVLSRVFDTPWRVELDSDPAPFSQPSSFCFGLSASGGVQGGAWLQVGDTDAFVLAQKLVSESAGPSAGSKRLKEEALRKLLRQIAELASATLKGSFGETKLEVNDETDIDAQPDPQDRTFALLVSKESSDKLTLQLRVSSALQRSLESDSNAASSSATELESNRSAAPHQPNIDLLLGVNLNLTLRFGRRVLPLRDILALTSGSVVELDQEVQEPADLLLGDKLIARGQVVIVDGNYGIQITEVADARQRIGTL